MDWEACRQVCSVILNIINQALCFNVSNFPELSLKSKFGSILDLQQAATDFLCAYTLIYMYMQVKNYELKIIKIFMLK